MIAKTSPLKSIDHASTQTSKYKQASFGVTGLNEMPLRKRSYQAANLDGLKVYSSNYSKVSEICLNTQATIRRLSASLIETSKANKSPITPNALKPSADSLLFAPGFQIDKLTQLFLDLRANTPSSTLLKQKLIEKAKATLDDSTLPPPDKVIPFFHFDDCSDVHFSFLIHAPPHSPWFSIIETYFGSKVLATNRDVYKIIYDTYLASAGLNQDNNYEVIVDVDYDEDLEPTFVIIPKELMSVKRAKSDSSDTESNNLKIDSKNFKDAASEEIVDVQSKICPKEDIYSGRIAIQYEPLKKDVSNVGKVKTYLRKDTEDMAKKIPLTRHLCKIRAIQADARISI